MSNSDQTNFNNLMILRGYLIKNKENIEKSLDMQYYRDTDDMKNYECGSAGCILRHAVGIPELRCFVDTILNEIYFNGFALSAFGICLNSSDWDYLFGDGNPNSIKAFIKRLDKYLLDTYPEF